MASVLAGCTLREEDHPPTPTPAAELPSLVPTSTPVSETITPAVPTPAFSETITDPFRNATVLLDGVCFEFLLTLNGQTWTWTTPSDLAAFYDRVDASELCPGPVTRLDFDFSQGVLLGTINGAAGCDAAHRVIEMVQDAAAHTQTVIVQLTVRPGCPYELVQPLLIVVPPPPEGYIIQIAVTAP